MRIAIRLIPFLAVIALSPCLSMAWIDGKMLDSNHPSWFLGWLTFTMAVFIVLSVIALLLTRGGDERRSTPAEVKQYQTPPPAPCPTLEDKQKTIEAAYQKKLAMIDRMRMTDDEKRDAKTACETEYLRQMSELMT